MEREQSYRRKRLTRIHPRMLEELMMSTDEGGSYLSLLMLSGIYREDFPWISEILTEVYREIRDCSPENAEKILIRLRRVIKNMMNSKMLYELSGGSKQLMMMADELPMILDMAVHRMMLEKSSSYEKNE